MMIQIPSSHPALPGHFQGEPIVPGVVLLDLAQSVLREVMPGARVIGMPFVKFQAPLRPDESVEISVMPKSPGNAGFEIRRGESLIASGSLRYATV